jgi:electron transport complex protein RnfB
MGDVHKRLAAFLDRLPAGYPATESGVELRILRKLFTEDEAAVFMHLTMLEEEVRAIARRARLPAEKVNQILEEMDRKGLISSVRETGTPDRYSANQFIVGFWEGQVNHLDRELVDDFEEYLHVLLDPEVWKKAPQLRTIPISESIPTLAGAMPYEVADEIIAEQTTIAVANCICRQERNLLGKGCGKPLETCMRFGAGAEHDIRLGQARQITKEEARAILKQADEAGLVLQPANSKKPVFICACCGDCCGVFVLLKLHPNPANYVSSPYSVTHDDAICSGCGTCVERCQMEAISLPNGVALVDLGRCIGCGLCVSTCSTGAMSLVRKPEAEQKAIPENTSATYTQLARARGVPYLLNMIGMVIKSKVGQFRLGG